MHVWNKKINKYKISPLGFLAKQMHFYIDDTICINIFIEKIEFKVVFKYKHVAHPFQNQL